MALMRFGWRTNRVTLEFVEIVLSSCENSLHFSFTGTTVQLQAIRRGRPWYAHSRRSCAHLALIHGFFFGCISRPSQIGSPGGSDRCDC